MANFYDDNFQTFSLKDQFLKLEEGETDVRVIDVEPVVGYEVFFETNEGLKKETSPRQFTQEQLQGLTLKGNPKQFVLFLVYDYYSQQFKFWNVTQQSILNSLIAYKNKSAYGKLHNYDITINRKGSGMDSEYTVMALPPTPIDKSIEARVKNLEYDMQAVFKGEYPAKTFPFEKDR